MSHKYWGLTPASTSNVLRFSKWDRWALMAGDLYAREILGTNLIRVRFRSDSVEFLPWTGEEPVRTGQ